MANFGDAKYSSHRALSVADATKTMQQTAEEEAAKQDRGEANANKEIGAEIQGKDDDDSADHSLDMSERDHDSKGGESKEEDFDLVHYSYKRVAESAAEGIMRVLEASASLGKEVLKTVYGSTSGQFIF